MKSRVFIRLLSGEQVPYLNNTDIDLWSIRQWRELVLLYQRYKLYFPKIVIEYVPDETIDELFKSKNNSQ